MAIRIVPHGEEHRTAVEAFNQRLFQGGQARGFYVEPRPDWIPPAPGAPAWREYHLAVDQDNVVRAAYALKPQAWVIKGQPQVVADGQGPVSEGPVNPRYASLALRMLRDMVKKRPLLYSFGHGGSDEPVMNLVREAGWVLHPVPFCFRVLRPRAFLRKNALLRDDPRKRLLLDALAVSGLGSLGLRALHLVLRARSYQRLDSTFIVEPAFDAWADDIWARNRDRYAALAVRDAAMMNTLVPQGDWPPGVRLRVVKDRRTIGWAVVLHRVMKADPRFGTMHVGNITDCFAAPEHAAEIISAAVDYLRDQSVEFVYANLSHPTWVRGCHVNGFVVLPAKRFFVMAPPMAVALAPLAETTAGLHLTNIDGHGPQDYR
jgi:hypothetical protein